MQKLIGESARPGKRRVRRQCREWAAGGRQRDQEDECIQSEQICTYVICSVIRMLHICTLDKYNLVTTGTKRRTWTIVGLSRSQRTWSGWHCASSWQQDWGTPLSSPKGVSLLKWILKLWIVWPRVIFRFFIFSTQENKHNILIWFLCWSETIVVKLPTCTHLEFRENVLSPCESTYHRLTIERLTSLQRSRHRSTQVDVELHPTAPSLSVSTHFAPLLAPGRSWN